MEIIIFFSIIILLVIFVKVFRSQKEQAEQESIQKSIQSTDQILANADRMLLLAEVKRQAEERGDEDTVNAVLNMAYNGKMPKVRPDGSYTNIYDNILDFKIAGANYRKNIKEYVGEFLGYLYPEPTNEHDPNAIAIYDKDKHHLGYIPADETDEVRSLGIDFPIPIWGELEECYDYEENRNYFQGVVYIELKK